MKPGLTERIIARWGNEKLSCFELETVVGGWWLVIRKGMGTEEPGAEAVHLEARGSGT